MAAEISVVGLSGNLGERGRLQSKLEQLITTRIFPGGEKAKAAQFYTALYLRHVFSKLQHPTRESCIFQNSASLKGLEFYTLIAKLPGAL